MLNTGLLLSLIFCNIGIEDNRAKIQLSSDLFLISDFNFKIKFFLNFIKIQYKNFLRRWKNFFPIYIGTVK